METTFIYALKDPRDNSVRYVGQSTSPHARLYFHMAPGRRERNPRKHDWLIDLRTNGSKPDLEILEKVYRSEADEKEFHWIRHFHDLGEQLTNVHGIPTNGDLGAGRMRWRLKSLQEEVLARSGERVTYEDITAATRISPNSLSLIATNKAKRLDTATLESLLDFFSRKLGRRLNTTDLLEYVPD